MARAVTPSFAQRLFRGIWSIATAPGWWWRGLSSGYKVITFVAVVATAFAALLCVVEYSDPCARHVFAKVHGVTPEGLPAEYNQSWCGEYKPGRAP